jgi:hypothetical protein
MYERGAPGGGGSQHHASSPGVWLLRYQQHAGVESVPYEVDEEEGSADPSTALGMTIRAPIASD